MKALDYYKWLLKTFRENRALLWSLILVNVVGFVFGIYYYWSQLGHTPKLFWLFVIDCPLYVLLFAFVLGAWYVKKRVPAWFELLVTVGLIKYGVWTAIVIPLFHKEFFDVAPIMYPILFFAHVGMAIESGMFFKKLKVSLPATIGVAVWFLANDYLDYFIGILPTLPADTYNGYLLTYSVIGSLIMPILLLKYQKQLRKAFK